MKGERSLRKPKSNFVKCREVRAGTKVILCPEHKVGPLLLTCFEGHVGASEFSLSSQPEKTSCVILTCFLHPLAKCRGSNWPRALWPRGCWSHSWKEAGRLADAYLENLCSTLHKWNMNFFVKFWIRFTTMSAPYSNTCYWIFISVR